MKVGDLVRFQQDIRGMTHWFGIVVAFNGPEAVDVLWVEQRPYYGDKSCEMKCFLEVVNESG
jgi:hypothetical protein